MIRILRTSGSIDLILVAIDSQISNYIVNVILFLRSGVYYKKYTRFNEIYDTCFARVLEYVRDSSEHEPKKCTWRETAESFDHWPSPTSSVAPFSSFLYLEGFPFSILLILSRRQIFGQRLFFIFKISIKQLPDLLLASISKYQCS